MGPRPPPRQGHRPLERKHLGGPVFVERAATFIIIKWIDKISSIVNWASPKNFRCELCEYEDLPLRSRSQSEGGGAKARLTARRNLFGTLNQNCGGEKVLNLSLSPRRVPSSCKYTDDWKILHVECGQRGQCEEICVSQIFSVT